jgi:hypothetical protein
MNIFRRGAGQPGTPDGEREMPEFVRREVAAVRPNGGEGAVRPHGSEAVRPHGGEAVAGNVSSLLERVSVNSVQEIDRVINELNVLKQRLQQESDRVAREITEYASLSQTAMQSTKVIAESLTNFRAAREAAKASE